MGDPSIEATFEQQAARRKTVVNVVAALVLLGVVIAGMSVTSAFHKPPDYDEAVYLSQVTPGVPSVEFTGPRSRGITILIAPLTVAHAPLWAVRLWIAFLITAGLFLAYRVWARSVELPVAVAALLFGGSWLTIFYATQIYPNMPSAVVALAAAGVFASLTVRRSAHALWALPLLLALLGLIRPVDATALTLALGMSTLLLKGRRRTLLLVLVAGLVLAWTPWVAEAYGRCGGPVARLHASSANVGGGLRNNAPKFMAMADGPVIWPERPVHIAWQSVAWIGSAGLFALIGIVAAIRKKRTPVLIAAIASIALAMPYLFLEGGDGSIAPRFLLPALACGSIPMAAGIASIMRSKIALVVVLAGASSLSAWHIGVLDRIDHGDQYRRLDAVAIGQTIRQMSGGKPCVFGSLYGFPVIAFESGCQGFRFRAPRMAIEPVAAHIGTDGPDPCSGFHIKGDPLVWLRQQGDSETHERVFVVIFGHSSLETQGYAFVKRQLPSGKVITILDMSSMGADHQKRRPKAWFPDTGGPYYVWSGTNTHRVPL